MIGTPCNLSPEKTLPENARKPHRKILISVGLCFLCVCAAVSVWLIFLQERQVTALYLDRTFLGYTRADPKIHAKRLRDVQEEYTALLGTVPDTPVLTDRTVTVRGIAPTLSESEEEQAYRRALDAAVLTAYRVTVDGSVAGYCTDPQIADDVAQRVMQDRLALARSAPDITLQAKIESKIEVEEAVTTRDHVLDADALYAVFAGYPPQSPTVAEDGVALQFAYHPLTGLAANADALSSRGLLSVRLYYETDLVETVPYTTEVTYDDTRVLHYSHILSEGQDGIYRTTYQVFCDVRGNVLGRVAVRSIPISETVPRIEVRGTRETEPGVAYGTFLRPINVYDLKATVTSAFMEHRTTDWFFEEEHDHTGLDFVQDLGTPVYASDGGVVVLRGFYKSYGNVVYIDHGNGYVTRYAHLDAILPEIRADSLIAQGQQIGTVGSTGVATGNHLHFEVRYNGNLVDPASVLDLTDGGY